MAFVHLGTRLTLGVSPTGFLLPDMGQLTFRHLGPGVAAIDSAEATVVPDDLPVHRGDWRANTLGAHGGGGVVLGLEGNDRLNGSAAADWLEGGSGDDQIYGNGGRDILWGGPGADFIRASSSAETFIFVMGDLGADPEPGGFVGSRDIISEFDPAGGDVIELYGFEFPPRVEAWSNGSRLVFSDGSIINLEYVSPETLAAHPGFLRIMPGPGPTPAPVDPGGPVLGRGDHTVDAGTTRTFLQGAAYAVSGVLTNNGTLIVDGAPDSSNWVFGVSAWGTERGDYTFVNAASGTLRVVNDGLSGAIGVIGQGNIDNRGLIEAFSIHDATGLSPRAVNWRLDNSGEIAVAAGNLAVGVRAANDPILMSAPHRADHQVINSGEIVATGAVAMGYHTDFNTTLFNSGLIEARGESLAIGMILDANGSFTNTGVIRAIATDPGALSIAFTAWNSESVFARGNGVQTYVNTGLIEADIAIYIDDNAAFFMQRSIEHLINSGTIRGAVILGMGDDEVRNSGLIEGNIELGADRDIYDGTGGRVSGAVFAGFHNDRLLGGDHTDVLFGEDGADAIFGGGGDDYIDGGRGSDALDGGAGIDMVSYLTSGRAVTVNLATGTGVANGQDTLRNFEAVQGSLYGDTITGSTGDDVLEGNGGDDILSGGGGDDTLFGDHGADTLTGGTGRDLFIFNIKDGADTITDFQTGASGDRLTIYGYQTYQSLQQVGADVRITLSGSDSLLLRNVTVAALGGAFNFVAEPLLQPATPFPQSTLVISELLTIDAGETVTIARTSVHDSGLVLEAVEGRSEPALFNSGRIVVEGGTQAPLVYGLVGDDETRTAYAAFVNRAGGVFEVTGAGATDLSGVFGIDHIHNAGLIRVAGGADATGVTPYEFLVNSGRLEVTAGLSAVGVDIRIGIQEFWNSGTIAVTGGLASIGVHVRLDNYPDSDAFVNSGTIIVTDSTAALDSVGVAFGSLFEATYINSGVIQADYALRSDPAVTSPQSQISNIHNTGELRGRVDLGAEQSRLSNDGLITGRIDLGASNDHYDGALGRQNGGVYGGDGDDVIVAGAGADVLDGGAGADVLKGGLDNDTLTGGSGADMFHVGQGADIITDFSGAAGDRIRIADHTAWQSIQQQGADVLITFSATDTLLVRNAQVAALTTGLFQFSAPPPNVAGGRGIAQSPPPTPVITGVAPVAPLLQDGGANGETLTGGTLDDYLRGNAGDDVLNGGAGNDILEGGQGSDVLSGGAGFDRLSGGDGDDVIIGGGDGDYLVGGAGADRFEFDISGVSYDRIFDFNPAEGDTIVVRGATSGYSPTSDGLRFSSYASGAHEYVDVFLDSSGLRDLNGSIIIYATDQNDSMSSAGAGVIYGLGGDDYLAGYEQNDDRFDGGAGDDHLWGAMGDDILTGGAGADRLDGDHGVDTAVFSGPRSAYTISTVGDVTTVSGPDGVDRLTGIERLRFSDLLTGIDGVALPLSLEGTPVADRLVGTATLEHLRGGSGADVIFGMGGGDVIDGGGGDDWIDAGGGAVRVAGGLGDDVFIGNPAIGTTGSIYDGDLGDDTLDYSAATEAIVVDGTVEWNRFTVGQDQYLSVESVIGGAGDDQIDLSESVLSKELSGGAGNDVIRGGRGNERLYGGDGADQLFGEQGDWLIGGAGDDILYVDPARPVFDGHGGMTLDGGDGHDTLILDGTRASVKLATAFSYVSSTQFTVVNVEDVVIEVTGTGLRFVEGNHGSNRISVGDGDDGGAGAQFLGLGGDDILTGGAADDFLGGGLGRDRLEGGLGSDTADYDLAFSAVVASLTAGGASNDGDGATDTFQSIENLRGSAFSDRLTGDGGANVLTGGAGDDVLMGRAGDDVLEGGAGAGDTAVFSGLRSAYVISTVDGVTTVSGPDGVDTLRNIEKVLFDNGAFDLLTGAAVTNVVHGTMAADILTGSTASDSFFGGAGDDVITGGLGHDSIDGGAGFDILAVSGSRADYRLLQTADDTFILKGADGRDWLTGVEMIRFGDGTSIDLLRQYGPDGWGSLVTGSEDFDGAQVLPGTGADTGGKGSGPLILPPVDDESPARKSLSVDPQILPGMDREVPWAKGDDEPLVLPGSDDPADRDARGFDDPLILPGLDEGPLFVGLEARLALTGGWMPTLDEHGGLDGEPLNPRHDDWM